MFYNDNLHSQFSTSGKSVKFRIWALEEFRNPLIKGFWKPRLISSVIELKIRKTNSHSICQKRLINDLNQLTPLHIKLVIQQVNPLTTWSVVSGVPTDLGDIARAAAGGYPTEAQYISEHTSLHWDRKISGDALGFCFFENNLDHLMICLRN